MLSGYAQSGKDTVAKYLVDFHKYKRFAFADILKDQVSVKYNIQRSLLDTGKGKDLFNPTYNCTNRQLLIKYSFEKKKDCQDYFVNNILEKINGEKDHSNIVISDWRYPNEYNVLFQKFNKIHKILKIRVNRWETATIDDESETSLDNFEFDYIIENDNNLDFLNKKIENILNKL